MGDLVGVDAVVLGLAAVDEFPIQGVTHDEVDFVLGAAVGEPVPTDHALDADDDAVLERRDGFEQGAEVTRQIAVADDRAGSIQNANVHGPCVPVNASLESVLLAVKAHHGLLGLGGA